MPSGYYRFPTIQGDTVIFVCEDDLWTVPAAGGVARRLTSNLGEITYPSLSPDGSLVAFVGRDEGQPEIYVMPALGGRPRRLTFHGSTQILVAGWNSAGEILYATHAGQPFRALMQLYTISAQGGQPTPLNYGPARAVAYGPDGAVVIGRNTGDPARWKRYRGGTAGILWIDAKGDGEFHPLLDLKGNMTSPMWLGERIYFLSDTEGVGNLYSCLPDGSDLKRHTDHSDFYARNAASDGKRIIYHAGADLFIFDPAANAAHKVEVQFYTPQVQRNRKFSDPQRYMRQWALHPQGTALAVQSRSYIFSFFNWEGPVIRHGDPETPARYRLAAWLNDGRRLVAVTDAQGEEVFVILTADASQPAQVLPVLDIGRPEEIAVNPIKDQIIFSNHRYEVCFLDLETHELKRIDKGKSAPISGFNWSPDGEWVAYSVSLSNQVAGIKLWKADSGEITPVTQPVLRDVSPAFDPAGKYLYFLSYRIFDPVADNLGFDYGFPRGVRPYLVTLQKDTPSPFLRQPQFPPEEKKADEAPPEIPDEKSSGASAPSLPLSAEDAPPDSKKDAPPPDPLKSAETENPEKPQEPVKIQIDLEGLQERIIEFPTRDGRYGRIAGTSEKKIFYSLYPIEGTLNESSMNHEPVSNGLLQVYDLEEQKEETFINGIADFEISRDGKMLAVQAGRRLRVIKAAVKPSSEGGELPGRKTGWIDLRRLRTPVIPGVEWLQMFNEAWRLQRDQYWTPDMGHIDWLAVHDRYLPLVERVASRSEFSDLVWEMQGELGTSHCYELGGDYRSGPQYSQGQLGAEFEYDSDTDGWKVTRIVRGDVWDEKASSPLIRPPVDIQVGDILLAINGQRLGKSTSPNSALVGLANTEVSLTFAPRKDEKPLSFSIKPLANEGSLHYREWVNRNRGIHSPGQRRSGRLCPYS